MQETPRSYRVHDDERSPIERGRTEYNVPHWEPDWWSRMMAVGSMLVAAAALWYARYPDAVPANTTSASMVATENPLADDSPAPTSKPDSADQAEMKLQPPAPESDPSEAPAPGVSGMAHALANSDKPAPEENNPTVVLRAKNANELMEETADKETVGDEKADDDDANALKAMVESATEEATKLTEVPSDKKSDDADTLAKGDKEDAAESVAADTPPAMDRPPLTLEGFTDFEVKGLVVEKVETRPLSSEFAVTMTVRNTSDDLIVISRVLFQPREIVENVSTEYATRAFGESSPGEFVLAFDPETDNQARLKTDQGQYARRLDDTINVKPKSDLDIRLAIVNEEHIGYGLIGKLTLEYNVTESLDVENTPVAFVQGKKEE